jgi:hypothetical protein
VASTYELCRTISRSTSCRSLGESGRHARHTAPAPTWGQGPPRRCARPPDRRVRHASSRFRARGRDSPVPQDAHVVRASTLVLDWTVTVNLDDGGPRRAAGGAAPALGDGIEEVALTAVVAHAQTVSAPNGLPRVPRNRPPWHLPRHRAMGLRARPTYLLLLLEP